MTLQPTDSLADLFSAAAAHLRGDTVGVRTVITGARHSGTIAALPVAAVMACGEYLRDTAEDRAMAPTRLLEVLCCAHAQMLDPGVPDVEGVVLAGVHGYLQGERDWWRDDQIEMLETSLVRSAQGAVRVLAAAMAWRASDLGICPQVLAQHVCLGIAERGCGLTVS